MKRVLAGCVLILFPVLLSAQTLDLVWEDTTFRGPLDNAQSVDGLRNRIVVGEVLSRPDSFDTDILIKAFNPSGHLIWTDEFAGDWVNVAVANTTAFVAGSVLRDTGGRNLILRAYDLATGSPIWGVVTSFDAPQHILVRGGFLAIIGYQGTTRTQAPLSGLLRVFDAGNGNELWHVEDAQPPVIPLKDTTFWDFDDLGRQLVIVGTVVTNTNPRTQDTLVRSYNIQTGHLRWETRLVDSFAAAIRISRPFVVVAGSQLTGLRLSDGQLQWQQSAPGIFSNLAITGSVAITNTFTRIQAFQLATGDLLWQQNVLSPPFTFETVSRVVPIGNRFLSIGSRSPEGPGPTVFVLRVLDAVGNPLSELDFTGIFFSDALIFHGRLLLVGRSPAGAFIRVYQVVEP